MNLSFLMAHPIVKALHPANKKFLVCQFLPEKLNPFLREYGIKICALIPFARFPHLKTVPTVVMMLEDFEVGRYAGMHTIVIPSSGNTAHAVARLAPAFGFKKTLAIMASDVPQSKSGMLSAMGEPVDVLRAGNVAQRALEEANKPGHYLLDQYSHGGNMRAHEEYTGPEIQRVIGSNLAGVAIALGSAGTACGVGHHFKKTNPSVKVIGVRPTPGQAVPGARNKKKMAEVVQFPWKQAVDTVVEVDRKDAFLRTRQLWSAVDPQPGPTSGMASFGLEQYLQSLPKHSLKKLKNKTFAFVCPDDGRFYSDLMNTELFPHEGLIS